MWSKSSINDDGKLNKMFEKICPDAINSSNINSLKNIKNHIWTADFKNNIMGKKKLIKNLNTHRV